MNRLDEALERQERDRIELDRLGEEAHTAMLNYLRRSLTSSINLEAVKDNRLYSYLDKEHVLIGRMIERLEEFFSSLDPSVSYDANPLDSLRKLRQDIMKDKTLLEAKGFGYK